MKITKRYINSQSKRVDTDPVCISLDWLSFYFTHALFFNEGMSEGDTQVLQDDCYLLAIDKPTPHFNKHLVIIYKATEVGHILFEPKSQKFFDANVCKVEFINHTLYSGVWMDVYNILLNHGLVYKAASRVDIAIDGVQYLKKLFNVYAKQLPNNKIIRLKNNGVTRAVFSPKVLNPQTMECENFNIGHLGCKKMITVYNKSLEITKSGKTYIQEYWLKNGLIDRMNDLEAEKKAIKEREKKEGEVLVLNGDSDIFRFELRLTSEAIKEIQNFSPDMLMTGKGLASIVKLHCKNYFELQYIDNVNISRCTMIPLLPYDRLGAEKIEKIPRVERDGLYKAKMTIHGTIADIYNGGVKRNNYNETIEVIFDRVERYNLHDYLDRKLLEWFNKYALNIDKDNIDTVCIVMNQIKKRNSEYKDSIKDLADRHNQADATAFFGD